MFRINSIFAGWMDVTIGDTDINFSYIEDAKGELDNLFNLNSNQTKNYDFDLEGTSIKITTFRNKDLFIISLYQEEKELKNYKWNYKEFIREYIAEAVKQKEYYIKYFAHWGDTWETEDWKELINLNEDEE